MIKAEIIKLIGKPEEGDSLADYEEFIATCVEEDVTASQIENALDNAWWLSPDSEQGVKLNKGKGALVEDSFFLTALASLDLGGW
jgi:hypothetical protein